MPLNAFIFIRFDVHGGRRLFVVEKKHVRILALHILSDSEGVPSRELAIREVMRSLDSNFLLKHKVVVPCLGDKIN